MSALTSIWRAASWRRSVLLQNRLALPDGVLQRDRGARLLRVGFGDEEGLRQELPELLDCTGIVALERLAYMAGDPPMFFAHGAVIEQPRPRCRRLDGRPESLGAHRSRNGDDGVEASDQVAERLRAGVRHREVDRGDVARGTVFQGIDRRRFL